MAQVHLDEAGHAAVTAAVTAAETGTDGEIVTILTDRSDAYHDVALHYAVAAMLLTVTMAAVAPGWLVDAARLFHRGWDGDVALDATLFALLIVEALVFLAVRGLLAYAPLRMALTPRSTKARRVHRRALQYFKVSAERRTQARVGILLFLSLDEHLAEIIADEAIHGRVAPEAWGAAMAALVDDVKQGRPADGMAEAVRLIGVVLAEHFPRSEGDVNELPDRLIEL